MVAERLVLARSQRRELAWSQVVGLQDGWPAVWRYSVALWTKKSCLLRTMAVVSDYCVEGCQCDKSVLEQVEIGW
jgi:hypothetical protein